MNCRILIWLVIFLVNKGRAVDTQHALFTSWEGREVVGIGIGMSEETADAPVSVFGHLFAYIRTVGPDGKPWPIDLETAINVAVSNTGSVFEANYHSTPLHRLLHEAMTKEGRSVVLFELTMSPDELKILIANLRDIQNKPVHYDLLKHNCSFYILKWLSKVRPSLSKETSLRIIWTPHKAAELIEENFTVTQRNRFSKKSSWSQPSQKSTSEVIKKGLSDASWCQNNEGALLSLGYTSSGTESSAEISVSIGQRSFESSPLPISGPTKLSIVEVSHYGAFSNGTTRVKVIDFEKLREISGEQGRLSQRLGVTWQGLPDTNGLRDWIARYETGIATQLGDRVWLSGLAGLVLCEGGPGPVRPTANAGLLYLGESTSLHLRYSTTGGQHRGLEATATLKLTQRSQLKAQWSDGPTAPLNLYLGIETRF